VASPTPGGPGEPYDNKCRESIFRLTVAGIRSMAEANRAERHAWVPRRVAAPRNPEAPRITRIPSNKRPNRVPAC